jgi:hypothetical protein
MGSECIYLLYLLTSALVGGEWSVSGASTHWIGCRADLRAGLDDMEKRRFFTLHGLELLSNLDSPVRSQSLYRLLCPSFLDKLGTPVSGQDGKFMCHSVRIRQTTLLKKGVMKVCKKDGEIHTKGNKPVMYYREEEN